MQLHTHSKNCGCPPTFNASNGRVDPTKTVVTRVKYERELTRRWKIIIAAINKAIVEEDGFGLEAKANAKFSFPRSEKKVSAFMAWLRKQQDDHILEIRDGTPLQSAASKSWQNVYLKSAYQKGIARSAAQMRKGGLKVTDRWIESGFFRPMHADAVGLIYTRAYSDLKGITQAVDTKISRTLALGLAEGKAPKVIAKALTEAVSSIGVNRSKMLARTEIIRAHSEATLNTYQEAELEGVQVESEFMTAGDNKVCPMCKKLEGKTYSISKAKGIIPVHPNCRCAWLPVVSSSSKKKELL